MFRRHYLDTLPCGFARAPLSSATHRDRAAHRRLARTPRSGGIRARLSRSHPRGFASSRRVASRLFRSCEISLRNYLVIPPPTELRRIAQRVGPSTCKRHRRAACNASKRSMSAVRALAFRVRDNFTRPPDCADFGGPLQVGVPIAQRADHQRISRPARRYAAVAFCQALSFEDRRLSAPASDSSDGPGLLRHLTHHSDSPSEAFTALEDGNVFPHRGHTTPHRRVARPRR